MDENNWHFVRFDLWCNKCVHSNADESHGVCNECLTEPVNLWSRIPVNYDGPRPKGGENSK